MRLLAFFLLVVGLTSCGGPAGPLRAVLGAGGPNVAANTQAGRTNNQVVGSAAITEQALIEPKADSIRQSADRNQVQADHIERIEVFQGYSTKDLIVGALLLLLDSPARWPGQIMAAIRRAFRRKEVS